MGLWMENDAPKQIRYLGDSESEAQTEVPWKALPGGRAGDLLLFPASGEYILIEKSVPSSDVLTQDGSFFLKRMFAYPIPWWRRFFLWMGLGKPGRPNRLLQYQDYAFVAGQVNRQGIIKKRWWRKLWK